MIIGGAIIKVVSDVRVDVLPVAAGMGSVAGLLALGAVIWWLRDAKKTQFAAIIQIMLALWGAFALLYNVPSVWALVVALAVGSFQIADGIEKYVASRRAKARAIARAERARQLEYVKKGQSQESQRVGKT